MNRDHRHDNTLSQPLLRQGLLASTSSNADETETAADDLAFMNHDSSSSRLSSLLLFPTTPTTTTGGAHHHHHSASETEEGGGKTMSACMLAIMVFFNTSGGPFGVEPAIRAAGNMYAIIGFAIMPILWSVPHAIMTYELSSEYPCDSGSVRYVEVAFGDTWSLLVGYLGMLSGVATTASLPSLLLSYILEQFFHGAKHMEEHFPVEQYGILVAITLVLAYVNYRGHKTVGLSVLIIFVISMTPFLIMVIMGIPKLDPSKWLLTPDQDVASGVSGDDDDEFTGKSWSSGLTVAGIVIRPFINNLYWHFIGTDQASHYSDMVSKTTFRNGIGGSLMLVSTAYLLPILVATGATNFNQEKWQNGSFATVGAEICGRWLGNWIVLSAGISLLAVFLSDMAAVSLGVSGMSDRGNLPSLFRQKSRHNTPTYALLLNVILILAFLPFNFGKIIELSNFTFCLSVSIEFMAFAQLRIRTGESTILLKTLYTIMLVFPMMVNIAIFVTASNATLIYGTTVLVVFGTYILTLRTCSVEVEIDQSQCNDMENPVGMNSSTRPVRHAMQAFWTKNHSNGSLFPVANTITASDETRSRTSSTDTTDKLFLMLGSSNDSNLSTGIHLDDDKHLPTAS